MSSQPIAVIFGAASVGNTDPWIKEEDLNAAFKVLEAHGVKNIDSAQLYGKSEERLGQVKAGERFTIDTKWIGGWVPGSANKENVINSAKESIKKLGVKQVRTYPTSFYVMHTYACHCLFHLLVSEAGDHGVLSWDIWPDEFLRMVRCVTPWASTSQHIHHLFMARESRQADNLPHIYCGMSQIWSDFSNNCVPLLGGYLLHP